MWTRLSRCRAAGRPPFLNGGDINMELRDTIAMMQSKDYKERFKAEYYQIVIRYRKLKAMLDKWDKGGLNFEPTCPRSTYNLQIKAMTDYIAVLEARAVAEEIELEPEGSGSSNKYDNIYDYIAKNMKSMHGDFSVAATDMSENEPDLLLATFHPVDRNGDTAHFYLHADGREEYTEMV